MKVEYKPINTNPDENKGLITVSGIDPDITIMELAEGTYEKEKGIYFGVDPAEGFLYIMYDQKEFNGR